MPCYRCGTRQGDPEPGKPTPWRQGLVAEHQVLICPVCYPQVRADLVRCSRCDGVRLVRRLDQVECLACRLTRDAVGTGAEAGAGAGAREQDTGPAGPAPRGTDADLAAEVARALDRILGRG